MKHIAALTLAAVTALAAAHPAAATPRDLVLAVRVEVQRDAGEAAMMRRLHQTARELCARTNSPLFPGHEGRAWKCRRAAIAAALGRRGLDVEA